MTSDLRLDVELIASADTEGLAASVLAIVPSRAANFMLLLLVAWIEHSTH